MLALRVASVSLRNFRNLTRADLSDLPRFIVLSGDNGQGKTSVLEAIYLACTTRSFRTNQVSEVIHHGEPTCSVRLKLAEGADVREQTIGLEGNVRRVTLQGKRPKSLAAYAVSSPVVVFHPGEMILSSGPASKRRTLLDRIALFVDPSSMDHRDRYALASRERQRALELRRGGRDLDAFEALMAEHGAALTRARAAASDRIAGELARAFRLITADQRALYARYAPGGFADPEELRRGLAASRERDLHRRSAATGPHRDDLVITLGGFDVRSDASQGEHRAITMALKMAELACIAEARGVYPVLLLDDVSSELDLARTALLFEFLRTTPGQLLLTTTRPSLIDTRGLEAGERRDFRLEHGMVRDA